MPDYQKMYLALFNAITDALEELQKQNIGAARDRHNRRTAENRGNIY